ncbi:MAG: hypothetical protein ACLQLG_13485, partial [Thermoguttaceae bacterium]
MERNILHIASRRDDAQAAVAEAHAAELLTFPRLIIRFCCGRLGATAGLSSSADASPHHTAGQASSG